MPLYDCVMLLKPHVTQEALMDLIARVGKHVYARNGVITEIKKFQTVQLGYGIKKLDGRHYQGQMMQMTMMATPNINKELQYLNKEDRLLRWLLVKHRGGNDRGFSSKFPQSRYGLDILTNEIGKGELSGPSRSHIIDDEDKEDDGDEYEIDAEETNAGNKEV